jgi:4-amino-4-deoxy-L-arabinose transferase-like glycosyltransferase
MRNIFNLIIIWLQRHPWPVACLLAAGFFLQAFCSSERESLTWDEPSYIAAGYAYWKWNAFEVNPSHPPLTQMLISLPLLPMDIRAPGKNDPAWRFGGNPAAELGRRLIFEGGQDPVRIARLARLPVILMGTCLVLCIFAWGSQLWGPGAGLAAALLAACDPNLLAHSGLATEDLGCTILMFAACWMLHRGLVTSRTWRDWLACGIFTGLALIAKYSSLILLPLFLVIILWYISSTPSKLETLRWLFPRLLLAGGITLLVVGVGYKGTFDYAAYLRGLHSIYGDTNPNPSFYLWGRVSSQPFWYYNLVALVCKTPLGTLLLLTMAAVSVACWPRRHIESTVFLLLPAFLIVGISCFDRFNLGLRRILPALPFLLLFAARAWVDFNRLRWLSTLLLASSVVAAAAIYPNYLSFFNLLCGGPENAPYITHDSNVDWGQDLPALAEWQHQHPEAKPMRLCYFGTAVPQAYGVQAEVCSLQDTFQPREGYYAMSVTSLVSLRRYSALNRVDVDWLQKFKPCGRAGYSILIYRFGDPSNPASPVLPPTHAGNAP